MRLRLMHPTWRNLHTPHFQSRLFTTNAEHHESLDNCLLAAHNNAMPGPRPLNMLPMAMRAPMRPRASSWLPWHTLRFGSRHIATHTHPEQAAAISIIRTSVDTSSAEFKENMRQMGELTRNMAELHARIAQGGTQKARDKHVARGKMLPREYASHESLPSITLTEKSQSYHRAHRPRLFLSRTQPSGRPRCIPWRIRAGRRHHCGHRPRVWSSVHGGCE